MSDVGFDGGEYREGFGADNLVDLNGGGDFGFDDFPSDSVADGLVGAGDLSSGFPGAADGQDPYANVQAQGNKTFTDSMMDFYGEEFKNGLTSFGQVFTESLKILGRLPIGSLGGLWAGWVLFGLIGLPIGTIGFLVTQHFVNAGNALEGGLATARTLFSASFAAGGLSLISGALFGVIMTAKLKRGDRSLTGLELDITAEDAVEDNEDGFASAEECMEEIGYTEDDDVYDMPMEDSNPYDAILTPPVEDEEPEELVDNSRKVVVENQAPEVISRTLDNINDMAAIGNQKDTIFKLAKDILPCYYPTFTEVKDITSDDSQWGTLEYCILSAIKIVTSVESDDITTRIKSIKKSAMSYSIVASRFSKMKSESQLEQFDKELKGFIDANNGSGETAVAVGDAPQIVCKTVAQGVDYYISIIMPSKKLVSLGDIYNTPAFEEYVKSGKKLPICLGLNNAGQMVLYDAKPDNGVMLCGQTRSGKSWFTMYYLLNLMILQSPMQHQFILIDPKATGLFDTMSLMPHVMGLHCPAQDDPQAPRYILALLEELIYTEGERRKKLFKDKGYENYWDYIAGEGEDSLPLITLIIDEYMSVNGMFKETKQNLGEDLRPQFLSYINNLVSKLPAYGLRLIIIPHRVPGLVEPMTRDLMKFKATFRSAEDLSAANLAQSKVGIPLPNAGDMAWTSEMQTTPLYTHTLCVGKDDNTMKDTLTLIAKAYYKLGVDIPDMSYMKRCFTRDDEEIVDRIRNFGK